jgi:hypothetical protein
MPSARAFPQDHGKLLLINLGWHGLDCLGHCWSGAGNLALEVLVFP